MEDATTFYAKGRPILFFLLFSCLNVVLMDTSVFSELKDDVLGSNCKIEMIDLLHVQVNDRLKDLLNRPYFKYYKTVLNKECEFWHDADYCVGRGCAVFPCDVAELPDGIRTYDEAKHQYTHSECESNDPLGHVDTKLAESVEAVRNWTENDNAALFCRLPDDADDPNSVFVDLRRNPERFNIGISIVLSVNN
ncbi:hypothetical protein ACOME3_009523 [Neoechinorhynchus agilis]